MNLISIIRGVKRNRTLKLEKEMHWIDPTHYNCLNTSTILNKSLEIANKYGIELVSVRDAYISVPTEIDITVFSNRDNYVKFAHELISTFSTYIKNFSI